VDQILLLRHLALDENKQLKTERVLGHPAPRGSHYSTPAGTDSAIRCSARTETIGVAP
jgi:hypothetical protein